MAELDISNQNSGNKTYIKVNLSEGEIVKTHLDFLNKLNIKPTEKQEHLPKIYWIPKLHKDPYKARFIAGSRVCSTKKVSGLLTRCLQAVKNNRESYCNAIFRNSGVNHMWILKNSKELLSKFDKPNYAKIKCISTWDFSTLYTSIPHDKLKEELFGIIKKTMISCKSKFVNCNSNRAFLSSDRHNKYVSFTAIQFCEVLGFLIDNIYVKFGNTVLRQNIGIPMGTDCAPLLADLFLFSYEFKFLQKLMKDKTKFHIAKLFNKTDRYIDDLLSLDNPKFEEFVNEIYPPELELKKTNETNLNAPYLDLSINIEQDNSLYCKLYDKRDDFNFEIVNFPHLDSNIPLNPAYGVYVSQLIRYCRACSRYIDFKSRHNILVTKLLHQGYTSIKLKQHFLRFVEKYQSLILKFQVLPLDILKDVGI